MRLIQLAYAEVESEAKAIEWLEENKFKICFYSIEENEETKMYEVRVFYGTEEE